MIEESYSSLGGVVRYFIYEISTGKLFQSGTCLGQDYQHVEIPDGYAKALGPADIYTQFYNAQGAIQTIPPQPTQWHEWNWATHLWETSPGFLDSVKLAKKLEANKLRVAAHYLPILYSGVLFDADAVAQNNVMAWMVNISNGLQVPPGFVWRDATNIDHPADEAFISGLGAAMVQRGSSLYQQLWAHKEAIDALNSYEDIQAYQITFV